MKTYSKLLLLFLVACSACNTASGQGLIAAVRKTQVTHANQQQQYEHGFVAGYMQAYIDACGNFDTIVPPIPKPEDGATSYADGYAAGKTQGQKDGAENCPEQEDQ